MATRQMNRLSHIACPYIYFAILVNLVLLLAFFSFKDLQYVMWTGVCLLFLSSFLVKPEPRISILAGLFLLSTFPFIIFTYIFQSLEYFDGVSWDSFYAIFPVLLIFLIATFISFLLGFILQKTIKNQQYKKWIIISTTALAFAILSGSVGWAYQFSIIGIIYFLSAFFNKNSNLRSKALFLIFLLAPYLLLIGSIIIYDSLIHVYPLVGIPLLSGVCGFICRYLSGNHRKTLGYAIATGYIILLIIGYWGMKNYLQYAFSLNDKPFVSEIIFDLYNSNDNSFTNKKTEGKTTVIYFHTKSCSVCYKKLPELESLYQAFKSDTTVAIIAAFLPYSIYEDSSFIFEFYREHNYNYPQYMAWEPANIYEERFNIDAYPHLTIIGKDGNIIHNGSFNNDPLIFVDNAESLVLSDRQD